MKDYLHKLDPAKYNIKFTPKKQAPAERVAFMIKVLQIVLSANSISEHKNKLMNTQVLHHCFSRKPKPPQRNSGKSNICKVVAALALIPRWP